MNFKNGIELENKKDIISQCNSIPDRKITLDDITPKNIDPSHINAKELWKKASIKILTLVRMNKLKNFINNVYYGIDVEDSECEDAFEEEATWVICPESSLKKLWDLIILQFMGYTITYLPYKVCFLDDSTTFLYYYELLMQIFFSIDIFITFFTAYYNENNVLVTSKIQISLNYLKTWFAIDLIACIPFSYILPDDSQQNSYNNLIRLGRLSRLYRLLRVIRLIRLVKLINVKKLKILHNLKFLIVLSTSMQRMIKTMMLCLVFVHLSSCFFFLIAKINDFEPDTWIYAYNLQDADPSVQYLNAFYWSMQTVTTVGFGDITPVSNEEMIFVIIWMAFGGAYYSFVISNLGEELENRENENSLQSKLNTLKLFANETGLPLQMLHKLKRYFQFYYKEFGYQSIAQDSFVDELPYTLRAQLMLSIHSKIILRVPFFMGREIGLILSVVPNLRPLSYDQEDIIYMEGDYSEQVFFINHGTVNLKSSNGISFHTINNGDIFGEIEVLQKEFRICSAQAHNRCLLFALNRKDFSKMIDDYPQVCDEVIFSSKKINKNYLIRYFYQKLEIYDELQHFLLKKKIRENCVKKKALFEDSKKRANESSNKGYGGLILSGTETNPQQSIQKTIQMKFMLKKEIVQKRLYLNLSQLGIGREIKEKLSESFNFGNKMSLLPVYSPVRITRKDSIKKTIRITQQELDRKVNQAMIRYYEKFMTEIPNLLKEIEEIKTLSDEKEKEYIEYMDKIDCINHYMNKIEKKQKKITTLLKASLKL